MRMRALDNVGAYAGRAPFQLGKPVSAIVGPYRIGASPTSAIAVMTNKTPQEAVRGFGQAPTNYAIETAIDRVAHALGLDRIELRRRNFIRKDEFPYLIPSGTHLRLRRLSRGARQGARRMPTGRRCRPSATRCAPSGLLAGIGISTCLEPSGGNSAFEPLLNPKNATTTWMDSCRSWSTRWAPSR